MYFSLCVKQSLVWRETMSVWPTHVLFMNKYRPYDWGISFTRTSMYKCSLTYTHTRTQKKIIIIITHTRKHAHALTHTYRESIEIPSLMFFFMYFTLRSINEMWKSRTLSLGPDPFPLSGDAGEGGGRGGAPRRNGRTARGCDCDCDWSIELPRNDCYCEWTFWIPLEWL